MPGPGEPIPGPGRPIAPIEVVQQLRWMAQLTDEQIVAAIRAAAKLDLGARWPELEAAEIEEMREQARWMSRSRLRAWREHRERQPTWLEVRALIDGLHQVLD